MPLIDMEDGGLITEVMAQMLPEIPAPKPRKNTKRPELIRRGELATLGERLDSPKHLVRHDATRDGHRV